MLKYRIGITLGVALTVFALVIANPEMAYARQAIRPTTEKIWVKSRTSLTTIYMLKRA
jgi:hypothetical protein